MSGINFSMEHGPFTNNGASPWYANVAVGSQNTVMKLAMDTGTNMTWVTSVMCTTEPCMLPTRVRFDQDASTTFNYIDPTPTDFDYGPWGNLKAAMGTDDMKVPNGTFAMQTNFGLGASYGATAADQAKWDEVDWDGCIGFPTQGPMQNKMGFFYEDMLNKGALSAGDVFVAFDFDYAANAGTVCVGDCDPSKADFSSGVFLPWAEYSVGGTGLPYLWTCSGAQIEMGGTEICSDAMFCFDTGSSRFKGDKTMIAAMLAQVAQCKPDVNLTVGRDWTGEPGRFVVPSTYYQKLIDSGEHKGEVVPQFAPLDGVPNLIVVGSIMMDLLYTIYVYRNAVDPVTGHITAKPYGTWVFNKPNGPKIIQNSWDVEVDVTTLITINEQVAK